MGSSVFVSFHLCGLPFKGEIERDDFAGRRCARKMKEDMSLEDYVSLRAADAFAPRVSSAKRIDLRTFFPDFSANVARIAKRLLPNCWLCSEDTVRDTGRSRSTRTRGHSRMQNTFCSCAE